MSLDRNIGWLAGVVDGEGSFVLVPLQDKRVLRAGRKSLYIQARLEVENTSEGLISKTHLVLDALGAGSWQVTRNFRKYKTYTKTPGTVHAGDKGYHRVAVSRKHDLKQLIELLLPELTCKAAPAQLVLSFLDRSCQVGRYKPTVADLELCRQLHELQGQRGKPFPMQKWLSCIDGELIPCQAEGSAAVPTSEGVQTRSPSSASSNGSHECPAPHPVVIYDDIRRVKI